jgi:hypothetical protein
MLNRTYIVLMPGGSGGTATAPLDLFVQSAPVTTANGTIPIGNQANPVKGTGTTADAAWYEWRGRTLRFEQLALTAAGGANPNFSPLARLGFEISVTPISNASATTDVPPVVQLSASFGSLASTDAGPTIAVPALPDNVTNGPMVRLIGSASTAGKFFSVTLKIFEDKDEGRTAGGR